ncbi:MAG: gliding motility-associated ABC transporter permease subunit GldF [Paludibacter sp.]|nr:gliding motility-associated ABC transporter permease subunit GldF [Paludibacter sp.]
MFSVYKKELSGFFSNATGYIIIGIFLTLTGLLLWIIPGQYNIPDSGYANVDGLFYVTPWLFLFLCPAISMRAFSEEKQTGTWELLITKPISKWGIVAGKYLAGWTLVILALLPTIINYLVVSYLAEPAGNVDSGAFWGSFAGLIFLATVYIAIGTFSSALTNNQIISFVLAVVISFFMLYGFEITGSFFKSGSSVEIIENLGINAHYKSMSRGVIDSRDVGYFVIVSFIFLIATERKISKN